MGHVESCDLGHPRGGNREAVRCAHLQPEPRKGLEVHYILLSLRGRGERAGRMHKRAEGRPEVSLTCPWWQRQKEGGQVGGNPRQGCPEQRARLGARRASPPSADGVRAGGKARPARQLGASSGLDTPPPGAGAEAKLEVAAVTMLTEKAQ